MTPSRRRPTLDELVDLLEEAGRRPAPAADPGFVERLGERLLGAAGTAAADTAEPTSTGRTATAGAAAAPGGVTASAARANAASAAATRAAGDARRRLLLVAAALVALVLVGGLASTGDRPAEASLVLTSAYDTVVVLPDGTELAGREGMAVPDGAVVRTGAAGRAVIGGVVLGPNTVAEAHGDDLVVTDGAAPGDGDAVAAGTDPPANGEEGGEGDDGGDGGAVGTTPSGEPTVPAGATTSTAPGDEDGGGDGTTDTQPATGGGDGTEPGGGGTADPETTADPEGGEESVATTTGAPVATTTVPPRPTSTTRPPRPTSTTTPTTVAPPAPEYLEAWFEEGSGSNAAVLRWARFEHPAFAAFVVLGRDGEAPGTTEGNGSVAVFSTTDPAATRAVFPPRPGWRYRVVAVGGGKVLAASRALVPIH